MKVTNYNTIELGGGKHPFHHPNLDAENGDIICNLTEGIPLPDNSVKMIFSRDFFEHLTFKEGIALLKECKRVLVDGGEIEFIIPDVSVAISVHSCWDYYLCNTIFGTRVNQWEHHRMWYCPELMHYMLEKEGWDKINITHCNQEENWYLEPKFNVRAEK